MNKAGSDPKVKKTLLRNYEHKVKPSTARPVVHDVENSPTVCETGSMVKDSGLSEPRLCSSVALASYMSEVKKSTRTQPSTDDLNIDRGLLCAKMTKKLNFHFNDKIYRNLIELNASTSLEEMRKCKKDRKILSSTSSSKKDLEPNIKDFCEDEKESDSPPKITVVRPKLRPLKTVEDGSLHKLVASFERV